MGFNSAFEGLIIHWN